MLVSHSGKTDKVSPYIMNRSGVILCGLTSHMGAKTWSSKGTPWQCMHVCTVCVWVCEEPTMPNQTVCVWHCMPIFDFFIMFNVHCQNKSQCHSRQWTEMCYLCTQAQIPHSHSHTHTHTHPSLFPTHAHFPSSCQDASKQTPVYWHETTEMSFFQTLETSFFIHQDKTTWILHWQECMVFYWGARKNKHCFPFSAKMKKDTDRERVKRRARALLGMLNNSVNQALRTAWQVKIFVCLPQSQFQSNVNILWHWRDTIQLSPFLCSQCCY